MPPAKGSTKNEELRYLIIDDFRPGIISNLRVPTVSNAAVMSVKPGHASELTTGCVATVDGELTPLPKKQTLSYQFFLTLLDPAAFWRPIGFGCAGPVPDPNFNNNNAFGFDELHLAVSGIPTGGAGRTLQFQYEIHPLTPIGAPYATTNVTFNGTLNNVPDDTLASVVASSWGMTWEYTRAINANFTTSPGRPTSFTEWDEVKVAANAGGPSGLKEIIIWPDPTAPAAGVPHTGTTSNPIHYFVHDARICALNDIGYQHGPYTVQSNELISYADPPGNWNLTVGNTVLDPQDPTGYGAWGSISYGELVFIKRSQGAIIVSGDLYSPQITKLPGVRSTGNLLQKGTRSPAGLIYCVDTDGAYAWNGSNTSTKISTLRDDFHVRQHGNSEWGITTQHCAWGPYVVFPNGWLYDTVNDSWWNLNLATGINTAAIAMMCTSVSDPAVLYTVNDIYTGANNIQPNFYSFRNPASTYTWAGQPIPVTEHEQIDILECIVSLASPVTTHVDLEIDVKDVTGANVPVLQLINVALQSNQPQSFRMPCGVRAFNITPTINPSAHNGTDPAPNVISVAFGYAPAAPVGQGG